MCIRKAFKASDEWFSGEEWKNQELINKSLLNVTIKIHVQSMTLFPSVELLIAEMT